MPKVANAVVLSEADRNQLGSWVRAQFTPQQVALRSRIVLMAADGKQDLEIAAGLSVNRHTPALWRKRFQTQGLDGIWEIQPGRGRKPLYDENKVAAIVAATLQTKPKGSTHWSGAFISVAELQEAIEQFLRAWNEAPRPFVWTATVDKIMAKVERARQQLEGIKPGWSKRKKRKQRR